jgi:hypothetical protein
MPDVTVSLTVRTCWKGHLYATPHWTGSGVPCPFCADDDIRSVRRELDQLRSLTSRLRGVITRLKKRAA